MYNIAYNSLLSSLLKSWKQNKTYFKDFSDELHVLCSVLGLTIFQKTSLCGKDCLILTTSENITQSTYRPHKPQGPSDLDMTVDTEVAGLIPHGVVAVGHCVGAVTMCRGCREV